MKRKVGIVVLAVVLAFAFLFFGACTKGGKAGQGDKKEETKTAGLTSESGSDGNTNGNIQNSGMFTSDKDTIYFTYDGSGSPEEVRHGLYRVGKDGSGMKLISDTIAENIDGFTDINVFDGKLYVAAISEAVPSYEAYAVDIKSGKSEKMMPVQFDMHIVDGLMYYTDGTKVYSMTPDGRDKKELVTGAETDKTDDSMLGSIENFAVIGNKLYYALREFTDEGDDSEGIDYRTKLQVRDLDTGKGEKLYEGLDIRNIQVIGDKVYYLDIDENYESDLYCNGKKLLDNISEYYATSEWLIYSAYTSDQENLGEWEASSDMYICKPNLSDEKKLPIADTLNLVDSSIIYFDDESNLCLFDLDTMKSKKLVEMEVPETEAPEAEVAETEVAETEAPEAEVAESEVAESEAPETEVAETEVAETEVG